MNILNFRGQRIGSPITETAQTFKGDRLVTRRAYACDLMDRPLDITP